jgi:hypothetical protein
MRALGGESPADRASQDEVVTALRAGGHLRTGRASGPLGRALLTAAATFILFTGGAWWGKRQAADPPDTRPLFALFLLEDDSFQGYRTVGHDSLVTEYTAWARELATAGQLVLGEELDDREIPLGAAGVLPGPRITGLFVLALDNEEAALAVARGCPHLKHGGGIILRPIRSGRTT